MFMQVLFAAVKGVLAVGVAMLFIGDAKAQVPIEDESGTITMTGTVEEIEVPERLITVIGLGGNTIAAVISPDVKDIKEIKLKETVTIQFTQEVATALRQSDEAPQTKEEGLVNEEEAGMDMNAPTVAEQDWVESTPSGGESDLTTIEVTDTISAINRQQRLVTFAGTGGKTRTIYIAPGVPGFDGLEVGDEVVLEVTRAVVVNITLKRA
ncbi:hypothetical protein AUC69_01085 [Methyloceanibacter superfactus]|uniref:Uncharacterized protein n=2 Tax=Methyloceanibacter superfactus TaxID=1774969 RepID=A0A1E3W4Q7_9HYPH|nr:hypothetical protein AUC69_01085 [Methyloceanibacter superfactus]